MTAAAVRVDGLATRVAVAHRAMAAHRHEAARPAAGPAPPPAADREHDQPGEEQEEEEAAEGKAATKVDDGGHATRAGGDRRRDAGLEAECARSDCHDAEEEEPEKRAHAGDLRSGAAQGAGRRA